MDQFVFYVTLKCKQCGSFIYHPPIAVKQKDYENWKAINRRRLKFCQRCRRNVWVEFEIH